VDATALLTDVHGISKDDPLQAFSSSACRQSVPAGVVQLGGSIWGKSYGKHIFCCAVSTAYPARSIQDPSHAVFETPDLKFARFSPSPTFPGLCLAEMKLGT